MKNKIENIDVEKLNSIYKIEKNKYNKIIHNELKVEDIKNYINMLLNNNIIDKNDVNNIGLIKRIISKGNNKYVSYQLVRYTINKYIK